MTRALGPVLAALAVAGALGAVHGVYADRWGTSGRLQEALDALPRVPSGFGDWVLKEDVPLDDESLARGGIKGYVQRRLENPKTREAVTLLIVCGRGGPISVHTPDVCYASAGYRLVAPEKRVEVSADDGRKDEFVLGRFALPNAVVPTQLEILWAWSTDGREWRAPENPRMALARSAALYKMYVVREFTPGQAAEEADSCRKFLARALPGVRAALAAGGDGAP